jgi:hypothetical protein
MNDTLENIDSKIALLNDQIDNVEKSGFFTEAQMDKLTACYRTELKSLEELRTHLLS